MNLILASAQYILTQNKKVVGMEKVPAPLFAKFSICFILLLPLSWIPGFFIFFQRKGKKGLYKDNNNNNETTQFGKKFKIMNFSRRYALRL